MKPTVIFSTVMLVSLVLIPLAYAIPSKSFYSKNDDVFDDWGVARTRAYGLDGFFQISENEFRPIIVFESLGENENLAYKLGEEFTEKYPDPYQRAEEIFYFVRDNVRYTSDIDQFSFEEYAQNADELAETIVKKGLSNGDCEDMALLLAVMFNGAGYRSAIVLAPEHAATLVYLPEYRKVSMFFGFKGEYGWIWAEATGKRNPLGWFPKELIGEELLAYEVAYEPVKTRIPTGSETVPVEKTGITPFTISPFFLILLVMWLLSMFRRRR